MSGSVGERLLSLVERIERLEEEKRQLAADIKDVYAEAKGADSTPRRCARWYASAGWNRTSARSTWR